MSEKELLILEPNTLQKQKQLRYKELENRGIPEPERSRAVEAEFVDYPTPIDVEPWPGPVTGIDLAGNINLDIVPDTGVPNTDLSGLPKDVQPFPASSINPYPNNPTPDPYPSLGSLAHTYNIKNPAAASSSNWIGTASDVNSEPSMEGEHGFNVAKAIPEWRYPIEDSQVDFGINIPPIIIEPSGQFNEAVVSDKIKKKSLLDKLKPFIKLLGAAFSASVVIDSYLAKAPEEPEERNEYFTHNLMEVMAEFVLSPTHKGKDVCDDYAGKSFNLMETTDRPILPSEGKGYTNLVHPNCHCSWKITKKKTPDSLNRKQHSEFGAIESHIKQAAKDHTLHTVKADGSLSKRTRGTNPMRETIGQIRNQFNWLTNDYLIQAKEAAANNNAALYLVRAATETLTDHRAEGEKYRRKLSGKELNSMARTATGKKMDVNHNPDYMTGGEILDSEYDSKRREIQMIVMETDPQIINAINNGDITAVSINGGNPRTQNIEPCHDGCIGPACELCNTPEGVILGEADGVGMTWVVTSPRGIMWRGQHIPEATPGIKNTVLEIL